MTLNDSGLKFSRASINLCSFQKSPTIDDFVVMKVRNSESDPTNNPLIMMDGVTVEGN